MPPAVPCAMCITLEASEPIRHESADGRRHETVAVPSRVPGHGHDHGRIRIRRRRPRPDVRRACGGVLCRGGEYASGSWLCDDVDCHA